MSTPNRNSKGSPLDDWEGPGQQAPRGDDRSRRELGSDPTSRLVPGGRHCSGCGDARQQAPPQTAKTWISSYRERCRRWTTWLTSWTTRHLRPPPLSCDPVPNLEQVAEPVLIPEECPIDPIPNSGLGEPADSVLNPSGGPSPRHVDARTQCADASPSVADAGAQGTDARSSEADARSDVDASTSSADARAEDADAGDRLTASPVDFLWDTMPAVYRGFRPKRGRILTKDVMEQICKKDWSTSCAALSAVSLDAGVAKHLAASDWGLLSFKELQRFYTRISKKRKLVFCVHFQRDGRWCCWVPRMPGYSRRHILLAREGLRAHCAPLTSGKAPTVNEYVSVIDPDDLSSPAGPTGEVSPSRSGSGGEEPIDDPSDSDSDVPSLEDLKLPYNRRWRVVCDSMIDSILLPITGRAPQRAYQELPGVYTSKRTVLYRGLDEVEVLACGDRVKSGGVAFFLEREGAKLKRTVEIDGPFIGLDGLIGSTLVGVLTYGIAGLAILKLGSRFGFEATRFPRLFKALFGCVASGAAAAALAHFKPKVTHCMNIRDKDRAMATSLQYHALMKQQTDLQQLHACATMYNEQQKRQETTFNAPGVAAVLSVTAMTRVGGLIGPVQVGGLRPCRCFSCGGSSSSRMPGRLCPACQSTRHGDPVVRAVRCGHHVCSGVIPIRYTGVVNMDSQHPPLKTGTETWGKSRVTVKGSTVQDVLSMEPRARSGPRLLGVGLNGAYPFCSSVGPRPLLEAILFRVFRELPGRTPPSAGAFQVVACNADCLLRGFFEPLEPMETWDWLCSYTDSRRRHELVRAWKKLIERGEPHRDYGLISAFVKTEKLPWFKPIGGVPYASEARYVARLIQAPHDETHLGAGPYLKPLTKRLKEVWHVENWIFYGSAAPEVLDQWLERNATCQSFFFADYSAFDATHSAESWALIEGLYARVFPRSSCPSLWRAIDVWRKPKGKCKVRKEGVTITYDAPICNASGRDDTALANALVNGLCLASAFAAELAGCELEDLTPAHIEFAERYVSISVVGDDSIVGCRFDIRDIQPVRHLKRFGLVVKEETAMHISEVTYLGQMPYLVSGRWIWGPTLGRRLYKAFWQAEPVGHPVAWVRGVAKQLALNRHVPVLAEIADRVLLLTKGPITEQRPDENKPWTCRAEPTPAWGSETLAYLARRYHVSAQAILHDLSLVSQIQRVPCLVDFPFLNACVTQDDL